ncbi:lyase family protein [Roseibium sp. AS2]|uniref:lyase family protein n=1 Tax=Roseibium sp. AS2 TaxID=3135781 RepID=UPI00316F3D92
MQTDLQSDYFCEERRWQSWLEVEAALARVQAEAGVIPDWAALGITASARLDRLDTVALRTEIQRTMAPVHAVSRCLADACGEAGAWVHWGATTQNVIDTGRLLVLKDVQADLKDRLALALRRMAGLAETHAETAMVGRTNRQHALPITFGFKVAGWIDEVLRVEERIADCEERLFQLRFGGAIGAFQSLGEKGQFVSARLAEELGLKSALFEGRSQVDGLIEYVSCLAMLGVAVSRIGSDLYRLMQTEVGEISEDLGHDVVGSSTMPHKVNPKLVVTLVADANQLRSKAAGAYTITPPSHEGDAVTNRELRILVEETSLLAMSVLARLSELLNVVVVETGAMDRNLASSGDLTALEGVMMHLAPELGRAAAHDALHAAAVRAKSTGERLDSLILALPGIEGAIDTASLTILFDPHRNTGQSAAIARQLAAAGTERANRLESSSEANRNTSARAGLS